MKFLWKSSTQWNEWVNLTSLLFTNEYWLTFFFLKKKNYFFCNKFKKKKFRKTFYRRKIILGYFFKWRTWIKFLILYFFRSVLVKLWFLWKSSTRWIHLNSSVTRKIMWQNATIPFVILLLNSIVSFQK